MLKLTALTRPLAVACATSAAGLGRGQGERLLADDVPAAGQDPLGLRDVEVVRRRDVDDLDRGIVQQLVERRVGARDAERVGPEAPSLGRAAEHAANLDTDPAQRLDVHRPDEARADDGRADVGDPPHALLTHLRDSA